MTERKRKQNAERQRLRRERLVALGFTQRMVWVHKTDEERYQALVDTLVVPDADKYPEQH